MLNSKGITNFFKNHPDGFIELVQIDGKNFRLYKDVAFSLDESSITFQNIRYTERNCGNYYIKKGNFMLPFNSIIRVEYIEYQE